MCFISIVVAVYLMYFYGLLEVFVQRNYNRFIRKNDRLNRHVSGNISYSSRHTEFTDDVRVNHGGASSRTSSNFDIERLSSGRNTSTLYRTRLFSW